MTGPYGSAAASYLDTGWGCPLPLPKGQKESPPKRTTGRYDDPEREAVMNWIQARPGGNIAMRLRPGVIGLDADLHKGERARRHWADLQDRYGELPEAPYSSSRDDGSGIRLFRVPADYRPADMGEAGETVHHGYRYVVVPPSVHPETGRAYAWHNWARAEPPKLDNLPELPAAWLPALARGAAGGAARDGQRSGWTDPDVDALLANGITRTDRTQRDQLRDLIFTLAQRGNSRAAVLAIWRAVVNHAGTKAHPDTRPAEPWTEHDFDRVWEGVPSDASAKAHRQAEPEPEGEPEPEPEGERIDWAAPTDVGYARRLIGAHLDEIRHTRAAGWHVWDGQRWALDDTGRVHAWAVAVAERVTSDALAALRAARAAATEDAIKDARRNLGTALAHERSSAIDGSLKIATVYPGVAVRITDFDADADLINFPNGTLNLAAMEFRRDHAPADMITKMTRFPYEPGATSAEFDGFFEYVQTDPEMRAYIWRLLGHTLEGRVTEDVIQVHYGGGRNGKGTLLGAVEYALGDYAGEIDPALLTARKWEVHPTSIADLKGRRFVLAGETDQGARLAEANVKRLASSDRLKGRWMHKDFFEFEPTHHAALQTNHRPEVTGTDDGMWRRLRLVPWDVRIPDDLVDTGLRDRIKHGAGTAILAALVRGYADWAERGLAEPDAVTTATGDWRKGSDLLGRFLDDRCETGPGLHARSRELYDAWEAFRGRAEVLPSPAAFLDAMEGRGYWQKRTKRGQEWQGIGLASAAESEPPPWAKEGLR